MPAQYPSGQNTFVVSHEGTSKLVVDFSRNVSKFALPRWAKYQDVTLTQGYYLEMTVEEAGRILNTDLSEFAWPDGSKAPEDTDGTESFQWKPVRTERFKYGYRLGYLAIGNASFDVLGHHGRIKAQQAMTGRTVKAVGVATDAGNYAATHKSAVASISGNQGNWAASTTARQDIKRSLNHAADVITKDTLAAIEPADLVVVMSPGCAKAISETQEIADYIKGSPEAYAYVKGDLADQNRNIAYGLPPFLYGFEIVIENTVRTTSRKGATKATSRAWPDATPAMLSRPGGLEGVAGSQDFSSITVFIQEDLTVETRDQPDDRLTEGRVVDNFDVVFTAPVSGFLFQSAV